MRLVDLNFSSMTPSWADAIRVGAAWFPVPCGSMESRWTTHQGSQLLSAVALYIRETGPADAHMEHVRQMIISESNRPGTMLGALARHDSPDVAEVAERCRNDRGHVGWSDPVLFLILNLSDWRAAEVTYRWPFHCHSVVLAAI
jgi:hypothetical protein